MWKKLQFRGRFWKLLLFSLILAMLAGSPREGGAAPKIPVAASILPLGDFCEKIGGQRVAVQVLVPPGASPHVYEPTPSAVARAMKARVFVYVGAGLDPWAERLLQARGSAKVQVVEAVAGMPLIHEVKDHQHEAPAGAKAERNKHHHHEGGNPHVWLDPVLAQDICRRIAAALAQADPDHRQLYEDNLKKYLDELEALDREITEKTAAFAIREYVSFHPAFTYFARRYGLKEVGVIEMAPGREPTPGHIRRIVADIRKFGVKAVFAEPQLSPRVAEVIAREAGARVLLLDPLGGRPPYGSDYLQMMRHNLAVMSEAMQ